jgi:DNA polymerase-3 subunit alpha (Gram-positive type)
VGCRDDIMLYLIAQGVDAKTSFKIMEAVRKGKVKKGGFQDGWVDTMKDHDVPEWYIESLSKIGYLFPKAHAVAYVTMAFRIAWFKVHEPLAFYATYFTIRAKAFDAEICCGGLDAVKPEDPGDREQQGRHRGGAGSDDHAGGVLRVLSPGLPLRAHQHLPNSEATSFKVVEGGLLPPFTSVHGLGEAAALDTVEKRKGKHFISIEEFSLCCSKLSKTHIEQLKALGAFAGMAETSQMTLF